VAYITEAIHTEFIEPQVHSLHRASLFFYAALSCDTVASNMPYRSQDILQTLDQALHLYKRAIGILHPSQKWPSDPFINSDVIEPQRSTTPVNLSHTRVPTRRSYVPVPVSPRPRSLLKSIAPVARIPEMIPEQFKSSIVTPTKPTARSVYTTNRSSVMSPAPSSIYSDHGDEETPKRHKKPIYFPVMSIAPSIQSQYRSVSFDKELPPLPQIGHERWRSDLRKEKEREVRLAKFYIEVDSFVAMMKGHIRRVEIFRCKVFEKQAEPEPVPPASLQRE